MLHFSIVQIHTRFFLKEMIPFRHFPNNFLLLFFYSVKIHQSTQFCAIIESERAIDLTKRVDFMLSQGDGF